MKTQSIGLCKVRILVLTACICLALSHTLARAEADRPQFDLSIDILSQYVFRGTAFSKDSVVIQPSMSASYKGFEVGMWGNLDTSEAKGFGEGAGGAGWNETNFTLSYSREVTEGLHGSVGMIHYALVGDDAFELHGGISYDLPWLTVGFTAFKEISHFPGWWLQLELSRNLELPWHGMSVDLGASFGYQTLEDNDTVLDKNGTVGTYSAFTAAEFSAVLNVPVGNYVTISPKIGFTTPLSDKAAARIEASSWDGKENHFFGGLQVAASF